MLKSGVQYLDVVQLADRIAVECSMRPRLLKNGDIEAVLTLGVARAYSHTA